MKHSLLKITLLSLLTLGAFSYVSAETIVELDGSSNGFVINDWAIDSPGFANTDAIHVTQGKTGTLSINNASSYTNLTVEILYKKVNQSFSNAVMCDLKLVDNSSQNLTKTQNISDNTSATENSLTVNFANSTAFLLKKFVFTNPNKNATIIYIKITGDNAGSSAGLASENKTLFNVYIGSSSVVVNSNEAGKVSFYNTAGQQVGVYSINAGENDINLTLKGLNFAVLTNNDNQVIERRKVLR